MSRPIGARHLRRTLPGSETSTASDQSSSHRLGGPYLRGQYGTRHVGAAGRLCPARRVRVQVASPWQAASQRAEDDEPPIGLQPGRGPRRQHRLIVLRSVLRAPIELSLWARFDGLAECPENFLLFTRILPLFN